MCMNFVHVALGAAIWQYTIMIEDYMEIHDDSFTFRILVIRAYDENSTFDGETVEVGEKPEVGEGSFLLLRMFIPNKVSLKEHFF
ncbi:hypothetical protein NDU88_006923 [Pleurodeles waltl]|uniref:Uncharacterized protein n=1 Tax=Pleurodeles waltl TaxID=8319 RepID=A0AAV7SR36_PLEWA|nr:hypothetical protein NDU88_006923 [Pleurodeles waltl]